MKKANYFTFAIILFVLTSCGYQPGVSEAFAKYRFKDGVTTVTIPGWAISAIAGFADIEESEQEILESIDLVRVIAIEDKALNEKTNLHNEFYEKIDKKGKFEELLVVREESESVTIFGRMEEDIIREMLILVGGDDNAIVYIKGEISPSLLNGKIDLTNPDDLLSLKF